MAVLTKAQAIVAERLKGGFVASTGGMMGHGERRLTGQAYYVHLVRWWKSKEKTYWGYGVGIWVCGNMSSSASLVTEVPEGMVLCPSCVTRAGISS